MVVNCSHNNHIPTKIAAFARHWIKSCCLILLLSIPYSVQANPKDQKPLSDLVAIYRQMKLPEPDATFKPCLVTFFGIAHGAFVKPGPTNQVITALIGPELVLLTNGWSVSGWLPNEELTTSHNLVMETIYLSPLFTHVGLAMSIQCQMRGYEKLAKSFFDRTTDNWTCGMPGGIFRTSPKDTLLVGTYRLGWTYWATQLLTCGTDRSLILERMKAIWDACPTLQTKKNAAILQQLAETVQWEKDIANGKVAPMIVDSLLDTGCFPEGFSLPKVSFDFEGAPLIKELISDKASCDDDLLQKHRVDRRLTRTFRDADWRREAKLLTVGDICTHILEERGKIAHGNNAQNVPADNPPNPPEMPVFKP